MRHTVLNPIGVEITDLQLEDLTSETVADLKRLLAEHGVAVLPEQQIDDAEFLNFLSKFGQLTFTTGETPVEGFSDLNVISNVGRTRAPRSVFHVDTSYVSQPPEYTALRAVTIPAEGGETLFTNQYRAYDTLSAALKAKLRNRTIRHEMTGLELSADDETVADHPVFRRHPISGRTSLYLSTPERCVSISGLDDVESKELIEMLYVHSTSDDNTLRHTWAPRDVVIWDNGCVLHRADHAGVVGDRVMHRGMVTADARG